MKSTLTFQLSCELGKRAVLPVFITNFNTAEFSTFEHDKRTSLIKLLSYRSIQTSKNETSIPSSLMTIFGGSKTGVVPILLIFQDITMFTHIN